MIFVTVGTQFPFDRLIRIVDKLAPQLEEPIVAQIYTTRYKPKHITTVDFMSPAELDKYIEDASLIICHAGMGSIISALMKNKPFVIFPRKKELGEHTTNHQLATTEKMKALGFCEVAYTEEDLIDFVLRKDHKPLKTLREIASKSLIEAIKADIG